MQLCNSSSSTSGPNPLTFVIGYFWISIQDVYIQTNTSLKDAFYFVLQNNILDLFTFYCESTIVDGVTIFVFYVGRPDHNIWFPTVKKIPIGVYTENL